MTPPHSLVNPDALARPMGYSHGVLAAPGRLLAIAGQIGWTREAKLVGPGFVAQIDQAFANVAAVLREAGGAPEHLVRLTIYVTDKRAYLAETRAIGEAYRRHFGRWYPAMALVQVADLLEEGAKVEVEATAVIP